MGVCPLSCHTRPRLLSPRCCHSLLGTRLPGRAPGSQKGARVGTAAFASASVPGVSEGSEPDCPQSTLGWHCCHRLSLAVAFSPGVGVPGFGVSPIFPGTTRSSAPRHTPGPVSVPDRLTGTRPRAGEGPRGWAEPGGSAGGCGAGKWGCPVGAEGFALLSGGVGGLGFGGEYPSRPRGVLWRGVRIPTGVPLTPLCLPPAGKPPKPYGGALGALGFRGEHGPPAPRGRSCPPALLARRAGCGGAGRAHPASPGRRGLRGREVLREEAEVTLATDDLMNFGATAWSRM